jgi:type II secretory pathway predicted ATPase ExeA
MKDLLAWFGLKAFPFDKHLKTQDVFETDPFKEAMARFDYIKRRGGILLLTGDPGVGKTLALRHYVDSLKENLFKPYYTPLSTLSRADSLISHQPAPRAAAQTLQKRHLWADPKNSSRIQRKFWKDRLPDYR